MLTQTLPQLFAEADRIGDRYNFSAPTVFVHIVTLIKRSTGEEASLNIETMSDRFTEVMCEITHQKAINKLFGYEIFEILDCNTPPF